LPTRVISRTAICSPCARLESGSAAPAPRVLAAVRAVPRLAEAGRRLRRGSPAPLAEAVVVRRQAENSGGGRDTSSGRWWRANGWRRLGDFARAAVARSAFGTSACTRDIQMQAEATWRTAQMNSQASLSVLRQYLAALGRVHGDKTVILISGGWPLDERDEVSLCSRWRRMPQLRARRFSRSLSRRPRSQPTSA